MSSSAEEKSGRTATPAKFRQLHVKLPTETPPAQLPPHWPRPSDSTTPSNAWLAAHPRGFLLLHNMHESQPMGKCMLLESLDTGELVVNKRLYRYSRRYPRASGEAAWQTEYATRAPGEVRFARLDDPLVEARLPDEPYFPELLAYGFPAWPRTFAANAHGSQADLFSLYFRRCNGGSLSNLMEMYADAAVGAPVPEPFVWHVIEQLTRAVVFLHTGLTRAELDAGARRAKDGWVPIVHRTIKADNVLLHFDSLDGGDGGGDPLDRCFPRVVLEGFDQANFTNDAEEWWCPRALASYASQKPQRPECWEDVHLVGELFRRLVTVHDCARMQDARRQVVSVQPDEEPFSLRFDVEGDGRLDRHLSRNLQLGGGKALAYSDELIKLLMKWEIPALQQNLESFFADEDIRKSIPDTKFLLDEVLPLAVKKVKEYRALGFDKLASDADNGGWSADVSWVMPDPAFERIPYSNNRGSVEHSLSALRVELARLFGP
ncbi:uncharacterized protein THITE_2050376, partial [Thermothielavioides terrestris NRRL 8126]